MQHLRPMARSGSMLGLWIVRDAAGDALLAKVQHEFYVLAFSSAIRAMRAREAFGAGGVPFLIVAANVRDVVERARAGYARGFIVAYDVQRSRFKRSHP